MVTEKTGSATPVRLPEMLENRIIEISTSDWASPIVLVKKDGSLRLCVDYRQFRNPMPTQCRE